MRDYRDHSLKQIIREQWCKPLIKYINEKLKYKFLYLGLPSPEIRDLLNWIDYIDEVIAFMCRQYPVPSSISQPKTKVIELEKQLNALERKGALKRFTVYDGYIEEVVLKGSDIAGNPFNQSGVVTIYNLDFCNNITTPLPVEINGRTHYFYKSETIRKLLEIQRDIALKEKSKKFIMFLTVHSDFLNEEKKLFEAQAKDSELKDFISLIDRELKDDWRKKIKLLKGYIFNIIKTFFCSCNFTPEFLPIINYKNDKGTWLMHFTIIGIENKNPSGIAPYLQNINNFLNQKFLTIEDGKIIPKTITKSECDCISNLVDAFQNSEGYRQIWNRK